MTGAGEPLGDSCGATMSEEQRYTVEEVLEVLKDLCDGPADKRFAGVPLRDWVFWATIDDGDWENLRAVCVQLETLFGFSATDQERVLLDTDSATTKDLAEFIAARAVRRPIRPLRLLGRKCEKAGLFRMLEETTGEIVGREVRIAPSTEIRKVLGKSQLRQLLSRLALYFPYLGSAPGLWYHSWISRIVSACLGLALILGAIVALSGVSHATDFNSLSVKIGGPATLVALLLVAFVVITTPVLLVLRWLIGGNTGPLDSRIKTYRDLVEILARQKWNSFE